MGANIVISQYRGARDTKMLEKAMTTTFLLSMLAGLFITIAGTLCARPLLVLLGTPADILEPPPRSRRVESCLGSQPTCSTRLPAAARAAERFALTVDLPIPPLPYRASSSLSRSMLGPPLF